MDFCGIWWVNYKISVEGKEPRIEKTLLKEDTVEDLANIKAYKVIIINPVLWHCSMDEPRAQKQTYL